MFSQFDQDNYTPDWTLLGTTWEHTERKTTYLITDFEWNCDTDVWSVQYKSKTDDILPKFTRSAKYFFGVNKTGCLRFTRILN